MQTETELGTWLAVWAGAAAVTAFFALRGAARGAGLVPGFLFNLWLIHWLGAAAFAAPAWRDRDAALTLAGFERSTYAVVAFCIGGAVLSPLFARLLPTPKSDLIVGQEYGARAWATYVGVGLTSYFILVPLLGGLPTANALISSGWNLLLAGLIVAGRQACQRRRWAVFFLVLLATFLLPLLTTVSQGFLGYGAVAASAVLMAAAVYYRPRWQVIVAGLALGYLALSLYVTYMRDRAFLREAAWGGHPLTERLARVLQMASTLEWFDFQDERHLARIEQRLNQNHLVGAAVDYLEVHRLGEYAAGETIGQALIAPIPRALWPDKPVVAGSGGLVSQYTGLQFAEDTSVGIGHVIELYVNFGTAGIVAGFLVLGVVVTFVDRAAGRHLERGDWRRFALWFLPGLSLLNVGGSLVELTASATAAVVTGLLVNRLLLPAPRRARRATPDEPENLGMAPRASSRSWPTRAAAQHGPT